MGCCRGNLQKEKAPVPLYAVGYSSEYWADWALAEYQCYCGKRYIDIFEHVKVSEIISMYSVYHEMDIFSFIEMVDEKCATALPVRRLKKLRKAAGYPRQSLLKFPAITYELSKCKSSVSMTLIKLRHRRYINCHVRSVVQWRIYWKVL